MFFISKRKLDQYINVQVNKVASESYDVKKLAKDLGVTLKKTSDEMLADYWADQKFQKTVNEEIAKRRPEIIREHEKGETVALTNRLFESICATPVAYERIEQEFRKLLKQVSTGGEVRQNPKSQQSSAAFAAAVVELRNFLRQVTFTLEFTGPDKKLCPIWYDALFAAFDRIDWTKLAEKLASSFGPNEIASR